MRIKKVKVTSEKKISMVYEQKSNNYGWDEYSFTCSDEARPEFYQKLKALDKYVVEMCELPDTYRDRILVKGVSVSYGGDNDVMGATIIAQMTLEKSNTDLNLNTPHKAEDSYSEAPADEKQLLDPDCVKTLKELYEECETYINGNRAQGKLFAVK